MKDDVRTIRQGIKDSLDRIEDKEIVVDGEKQISYGGLPFPFPFLLQNMAGILYVNAVQLLKKPIDNDILGIMTGIDTIRGMHLCIHLMGFLEWWLEREAVINTSEDGSDEIFWYDTKEMIDAWNEYTKKGSEDEP